MDDENTPTLQNKTSSTREEKINVIVAKRAMDDKEMKRKLMFLACFCLSFIVLLIVCLVNYYIDCQEERELIDGKTTTISEKLMDYTVDVRANCTNQEPCTEWTCGYVKSHFHRTPDECEYYDWSDYVTYMIYGLLICACLQALCAKEAKK